MCYGSKQKDLKNIELILVLFVILRNQIKIYLKLENLTQFLYSELKTLLIEIDAFHFIRILK